ncbi:MAG: trigger factor [Solirubrobacteraceae bacterium]
MSASVTTSVTQLPESRVRVEAVIPAGEVERRMQEAARELGKEMKIPGFRKGKVPPTVVIRRLGRGTVLDEAMRNSLGAWYVDAISSAGIVPVGEPDLDVGDAPGEGQPLSLSIEIGVRPRARLGQYKGLEVGRREPEVADAVIDAELERMRDTFATLDTVERAAAAGDHLVIDYVGRVDEQPFDGGEGRDQLLELGSGRLVPGFEEQLVGAVAGEQRVIDVTFPEQNYGEHLAGKQASFAVTVSEVKAKRLPELDDGFAAESAGFDTLAELREDIAARAREAEEHKIEHEFERAVLDAAVAEAQLEVPDRLVHARAHELVQDTLGALERRGVSRESYLNLSGMDEERLVHEAEPDAARSLRREAAIAAIIEAEQIEPSDEELLAALEPAAKRSATEPGKLLERLRENGRIEAVRADVASRQALELLVREAKPISVAAAAAREALWTPGKSQEPDEAAGAPAAEQLGKLWTPGG